jgi:hypothetical protein
VVSAQFGVGKKKPQQEQAQSGILDHDESISSNGFGLDMNDPELLEAIQMFADMSPEEMMETMEELKEMFSNDPETLREIEEVILELSKLDADDIEQQLRELMEEEDIAKSMAETMELLQNADQSDWKRILENKDAILEAVIATGAISEEEIAEYQRNPDAWERELLLIWEELKMHAADAEMNQQANSEL